ncbi:glycosyltransferase [Flagellimonas nanhaiensis]|uniref:Glycosyltransferase n=1 Tax=Flagellimonas nanhaiensis TaxID=2292706 RepID=A0A371JUV1_9FLAO|nr:glycosyltransferase [Allomuricauda nanhaiensis]RDY61601.1 glycosyltransferase [Allomuricauda nanhaiensis]
MNPILLIIGHVWPEPSTTAAGNRMEQLIHAFLDFGFEVVFGSTAAKSKYSLDLVGIGVREVEFKLNHPSFDDFVKELKPNYVVFDRFMTEEQFGWRVSEQAPDAVKILNTEDLHSLRKSREECHRKDEKFSLDHWKDHSMTLREVASIYRSDLTLMISSFETQILVDEIGIPKNLLLHLPFMLERLSKEEISSWPKFEERKDFICIGNGKHQPNIEAIKTLKNTIWPIIRRSLPKAKLHVYGAYLPQQIIQMHKPQEGFEIKGWAEDLGQVLKNGRLLLAPLSFGAGIKGKLVDAMQNGTPSVTTSLGAEGMHDDLPWGGCITNEWATFAQSALELYQNKDEWEQSQANGIAIVQTHYQRQSLQKTLLNRLKELQEQLPKHRTQNLVGRLLSQQERTATKYMGKWIQEKNKH